MESDTLVKTTLVCACGRRQAIIAGTEEAVALAIRASLWVPPGASETAYLGPDDLAMRCAVCQAASRPLRDRVE